MTDFTIYPAIDLKDGKCVRLRQGCADDATVYGDDPVEQVKEWVRQGAQWLHVVDLDGAFQGHPVHLELLARMVAAADGVPVQVGGGLRTDADLDAVLGCGVKRAILGTRALLRMDELAALAARYGDSLAVGIDARNGWVQIKGWTETSDTAAVDLARRVADAGIKTIIYTDTATDGMLRGPNFAGNAQLCDAVGPGCGVIASGGVANVDDIRKLRALRKDNLIGAIVGKALYEGTALMPSLLSAASAPLPAE